MDSRGRCRGEAAVTGEGRRETSPAGRCARRQERGTSRRRRRRLWRRATGEWRRAMANGDDVERWRTATASSDGERRRRRATGNGGCGGGSCFSFVSGCLREEEE
ncbi:unnamed protein product [Linum trigynum]|uniref:Uncharacterized protein n=1 Tax=Linum trigynum TaxID=586398 RepID=A0AAV2F2A2_9ROSI